mgnify:CR=1 FL=1|tara:strand:+ start:2131 stop:3342 length:1212 start_codon:yes stop_codon:yes gene_type:complete
MKSFITSLIFVLCATFGKSQTFTLGGDAGLFVGSGASFYFGGNTTLNGNLNNQGQVTSFSDINFVSNTDVGSIKFTGTADQELVGEGLIFFDFTVDKDGQLRLNPRKITINGALSMARGVIKTDADQQVIIKGNTTAGGTGYIEGRAFGVLSDGQLTFPTGINGFTNYITFSGFDPDITFEVQILQPDAATLNPDEDIVGIADQVEWQVVSPEVQASAFVSVDFSGIDLENFQNGEPIRSEKYEAALVMYTADDTLYHSVPGVFVDGSDPQSSSFGRFESTERIPISSEVTRLNIALIPVIIRPHFFVPNSFAPNGELDENRLFRPFYSGDKVTSIYMRVFDSFNKEVYLFSQAGDDVDLSLMGWDGTMPSGVGAPNGVYYYTIQLQGETENHNQLGAVLLVK